MKEMIIASAYKVKPEYVCKRGNIVKTGTNERDDIYGLRIAIDSGQCTEPLIMGNRLDSSDIF